MSLSTFYSIGFVNKKLSKTIQLLLFVTLVFTFSCNNPLRKGEKLIPFDRDEFNKTYPQQLLDRVKDDENDHLANYQLARHFFEKNEIARAWYHINLALDIEEKPPYLLLKAHILLKRKQFFEAKAIARKLEKSKYQHIDTYKILTSVFLNQKETDSTMHYISFMKRIDKNMKELHYYTALNYQNANDTIDAIREYYNALTTWPENAEIYINLSNLLIKKNKLKQAEEVLDKGMTQSPNNTELLLKRGDLLFKNNLADSAITFYRKAHSKTPKNNHISYVIGDYHAVNNNNDSALFYFSKAIDYKGNNVPMRIADIYFSQYKNELALEHYKQALVKNPDDSYLQKQISRCKWRINYRNTSNLSSQNDNSDETESHTTQTEDTLQ